MLGDVAATYIGIRTTEQLISIAHDNVRKQEEQLRIAQARFHSGDTSELDVFRPPTSRSDPLGIPQLQIQLQQGRDALACCSASHPSRWGVCSHIKRHSVPPVTIAVGIPADLLRRRPESVPPSSPQWPRVRRSASPIATLSGDQYFGTFGGAASTANGHNLGQVFNSSGVAYAGGPAFQWNILNYGQITNNVRLQDATLQQLLVDYQNPVLVAEQQVGDGSRLSSIRGHRRNIYAEAPMPRTERLRSQ